VPKGPSILGFSRTLAATPSTKASTVNRMIHLYTRTVKLMHYPSF